MMSKVTIWYKGAELEIHYDYQQPDQSVGFNGQLDIEEIYHCGQDITHLLENEEEGIKDEIYDVWKKFEIVPEINKENLQELGFKYESYFATGQCYENASIMWSYGNYHYRIDFESNDRSTWHMYLITNARLDEKHQNRSKITVIPLRTIRDIIEAYEFITNETLTNYFEI